MILIIIKDQIRQHHNQIKYNNFASENFVLAGKFAITSFCSLPLQSVMSDHKILLACCQTQPASELIRIHSKFTLFSQIQKIKPEQELASLTILTSAGSYIGSLKRKHFNKELVWNTDLMARLLAILGGRSGNIVVSLLEAGYGDRVLTVGTELQAQTLRIVLFELVVRECGVRPFERMRALMEELHAGKEERIRVLRAQQKEDAREMDKINGLMKELVDGHRHELNLIEEKFIPLINQVKSRLKKNFGLEQQDPQALPTQLQNQSTERTIFKFASTSQASQKHGDDLLLDILN